MKIMIRYMVVLLALAAGLVFMDGCLFVRHDGGRIVRRKDWVQSQLRIKTLSDSCQKLTRKIGKLEKSLVASRRRQDSLSFSIDSLSLRSRLQDSLIGLDELEVLRQAQVLERLRAEIHDLEAKLATKDAGKVSKSSATNVSTPPKGKAPAADMSGANLVYHSESGTQYGVFVANVKDHSISMKWQDKSGQNLLYLSDAVNGQVDPTKVLMATNAGMFEPDFSPQGLYVENSVMLKPIDLSDGPPGDPLNFYLKPNGIFFIEEGLAKVLTTDEYVAGPRAPVFATQSGPMLVANSVINEKFQPLSVNKKVRSGVGVTKAGKVIFAISLMPVCFYDFASLFLKGFECPNALYLDGVVSEMLLPELGMKTGGGPFGAMILVTAKGKRK